ncbi:Lactobacillus shifted protein [Exophiala dermatitidis]|uniref:NADH dehydrogenase (Ubiquinone) Fe-S protein 6 n=1 Tax=Exophiala dermatitidis (strain ATCC 34100 / CBS 525.76 / NIH/UT8656) TaxID=858893 RepID=H6BVA6_EXODN|nr:NADH dehydrogenase (ubiquinone) Fe-S protein 6 [Exophiala dermatitidis NIH/UT8656]EHY55020.1 NADH dehydrogenase (ubiquinone) Fe-S protein 6 [Exophiala dermatitidis NIH/UT8656]
MASLTTTMRTRIHGVAARAVRGPSRPLSMSARLLRAGPGTGENFEQANDPSGRKLTPNVSKTNETPVDAMGNRDAPLQELATAAEQQRQMQAPNREKPWSRSQMPRELAMTGPRFEQTIFELQPQPLAAIELIHKQPVRWVDAKSVACDGGGGPLGHPRVFINLDKQQICWCEYCGIPYAKKEHKEHLESLPSTSYPLAPTGDPFEVELPKTPTMKGEVQGHYPLLKGEHEAEAVDNKPLQQR